MSDDDKQQPETTPAYAEADAPPQKTRFRDRVLGIRAVIAVAAASLILGGVGGAAIGVLADGHGDRHDGRFGGPGHVHGQMPPGPGGPGFRGRDGGSDGDGTTDPNS